MFRRIPLFAAFAMMFGLPGCSVPYTAERGLAFSELPYPMETRTLEVDGVRIAYADAGQGPQTLVLIHGLGSYMSFWAANFNVLAGHYRVVALDLPGYGRSSKGNYHYSMAFFARSVDALIEALHLEHVTLMGHSMGGQIAITYALLFPGKAQRLVLASPAGLEPFNEGEGAWLENAVTAKFLMQKNDEAVYEGIVANFYDMPKEADFLVEDRLKIIGGPDYKAYAYANSRSVAAMIEGPVFDSLKDVTVPVLLIYGEQDGLIPNSILHGGSTVAVAKEGASRFPNARLVMIPKAGHLVQMEQPEIFNQTVLDYLTETR